MITLADVLRRVEAAIGALDENDPDGALAVLEGLWIELDRQLREARRRAAA